MDLGLDPELARGYKSGSQITKNVTEPWAEQNMFCPACPSPRLTAYRPNRKVEDFYCPRCNRRTQVKAKRGKIGRTIANSAYAPKMAAIRSNRAPDYLFMAYDVNRWCVIDMILVPGHFMTTSAVEKRAPLKATARRAGWVGSNILLERIPASGKIKIVEDEAPVEPRLVRDAFRKTAFVAQQRAEARGWLADVMACIDRVVLRPGESFSLGDVYDFTDELSRLHPANQNVRPKIRQQLQVLREHGRIQFEGRGRYRLR